MNILNELLSEFPSWGFSGIALLVLFLLGFYGASLWMWTLFGAVLLSSIGAPIWMWIVFGGLAIVFNITPIRSILSKGIMLFMEKMQFLPQISTTEQEAIDAGTVWVEGELFSGKPDFAKIMGEAYPELSAEEQAFLDGPAQQVCEMTDDWQVTQERDLPKEVWEYLKKERFFGLIIPKKYGGHGFSALANSSIVTKVSSVTPTLGITVMVPNSLGPAELLIHYGTEEQKNFYLPRLASGIDIPAFALTEPNAGSDAGAITASGVIFKGDDGKLYIKLNWQKRYITLAAISTVLGLAFKLKDPENLLGKGENLGITCGLIPTNTPGVVLGKRHDPMGIPFYNCPTEGHDVVLPLEDAVIGGIDGAGKGWRMLMESLAAGRGISLPASSTGGTKVSGMAASAHAVIRKQFGLNIGKFEGIEEPLARIAGKAYILEAARKYTCAGIDKGAKPAVVTAMAKYNFTEMFRQAMNDAMDVLGGNAISRGPRNVLASGYTNMPISITVEGANILTRTLMIFGQGAIRCHPYALKEIQALQTNDVKAFDSAFWSHIGHVVRNLFRSFGLGLTRGLLAGTPSNTSRLSKKYIRKLSWASAKFALLADLAMGSLGGDLKRKEKITGRFADIFSWLYLSSTVLRRFEAEGRLKEDEIFVHWSMQYALFNIQQAFEGLYQNLQVPGLTWLFKHPLALIKRMNSFSSFPSDKLGHKVAQAIQVPNGQRERLFGGIFVSQNKTRGLARLEHAMKTIVGVEPIMQKLKDAVRSNVLPKTHPMKLVALAVEQEIITSQEAKQLNHAEMLRNDAIQVDAFTLEEYMETSNKNKNKAGDSAPIMVNA